MLAQAVADQVINGTDENDELEGTRNRDEINGLGGNDTLLGLQNNDTINGGTGNDALVGGLGKDRLNGNNGDDIIDGSQGRDRLNGNRGNDLLLGGAGNDILNGGRGEDFYLFASETDFNSDDLGIDTISQFVSDTDQIVLSVTTFTTISSDPGGIGFSNSEEFAIVDSNRAASRSRADIVYNSVNGTLFYNENGRARGFGEGGEFAILRGAPELLATDFLILP